MRDDRPNGFTDAELLENLPALESFARRFYRSGNDIDDLVQETLAKAIAHSASFKPGTQLRSWLFTIMRNTFCTKFKISRREQVGGIDDAASWGSSPPTQDWEVRGQELEKAIHALPEGYRVVVDLVLIQGLSYETAAQRCNVAIGTIKSRVSRARHRLTELLDIE
ncbi:sigma-70 family RNA polymerase sigma factor [Rhizobium tubonense]|uniref:RNA polymerase sigma factor n=1 Tax=Rhizobium tubonense TaxID=484088 RepID=A0A2W4CVT7_9HYPH|nr:sigma-70 family RNA polymerase sigma factor [Rhizobium tubonense]PZM16442.1 RNA polymerase subunit sigma [Rhizobium tubonense]